MGTETIAGTQLRHLYEVRDALKHPDLIGKITQTTDTNAPMLTVVNTQAPGLLSAELGCEQHEGGWRLVFDSGETCAAEDREGAAGMLRELLLPRRSSRGARR